MCRNRFDEDFDFKEPAKGNVESYLNWYMYYEIGAEKHASRSMFVKELKDYSLVDYDFSNKDLYCIRFENCNLSSCRFNNSNLYNASFINCIICYADFSRAVCDAEMRIINKDKLPMPDFSYFETIDSVDYPYRIFMNSWWERAFCYFESLLVGPKDMLKNHFYQAGSKSTLTSISGEMNCGKASYLFINRAET